MYGRGGTVTLCDHCGTVAPGCFCKKPFYLAKFDTSP